jgi:hypothetical protein
MWHSSMQSACVTCAAFPLNAVLIGIMSCRAHGTVGIGAITKVMDSILSIMGYE